MKNKVPYSLALFMRIIGLYVPSPQPTPKAVYVKRETVFDASGQPDF